MNVTELRHRIEQYLEGLITVEELHEALGILGLPPHFQFTPQVIDAISATLSFAEKNPE